jgi:DNA repair protein RadC
MTALAAKFESLATYGTSHDAAGLEDDGIIQRALSILARRLKTAGEAFTSPQTVKNFCRLHIGDLDFEVFGVLFLDSQNRLIEFKEMFRGTLNQTSVYPREVARECLRLNASAVVLTHNHPSGNLTPSGADQMLTRTLKSTLELVDVRVLDHIITSRSGSLSMAESGAM